MRERLTKAARDYQTAAARLDAAREALHTCILAALADGMTQAEVTRTTGYTRETIRRISRPAIPAARERSRKDSSG